MDTSSAAIVGLVILALVAVAAFAVYGGRMKLKLKGLFGTALELDGSNPPAQQTPGVRIEDADAGGKIEATDGTGRGADLKKVRAKGDIVAKVSPGSGDPPPKA